MCTPQGNLNADYELAQARLADAGLLIRLGVPGLYGLSGVFEGIVEAFEDLITRRSRALKPKVMRFPPAISRADYLRTTHIENFPDLLGSVHSFMGNEREHTRLLRQRDAGEEWTTALVPSRLMLTPAACYPLYPTVSGTLPDNGLLVDLRSFVFRHEPSPDPARMQFFRQREFVRLGSAEQARNHQDQWLALGQDIYRELGLDVRMVVANDPFFGRSGRIMAAAQTEQVLKYELVTTVASAQVPTAIASCNCHLDHFGESFGIHTADGSSAHTACIGFGLERTALALFFKHGFDPDHWPGEVKNLLAL